MSRMSALSVVVGVLSATWLESPAKSAESVEGSKIKWKRTELDSKFRSEGAAVGDFNHDGKMDIAAGSVWYAAPDWKMHLIRDKAGEFDPNGYSDTFCNFAEDRNGDGWTDLIVVDFPGAPTWWFENPQGKEGPWKRHVCVEVTNNESPQYLDVDGDGKRELLFATSPDPKQPDGPGRYLRLHGHRAIRRSRGSSGVFPATVLRGPISSRTVLAPATSTATSGLDLIVTRGWWEAPADASSPNEWKFTASPFGEDCSQMYAYDFDGDGDNDVLSTSAHRLGMWWHEQSPEGWKTHKISDACSQTHALEFKDINGDGRMDFITGKRWWAHGPKGDVNPESPPVVLWFELSQKDGKPEWKAHEIDHNSGVGTQFEVADINGDKLLDVAVSNKRGVFVFEQVRE